MGREKRLTGVVYVSTARSSLVRSKPSCGVLANIVIRDGVGIGEGGIAASAGRVSLVGPVVGCSGVEVQFNSNADVNRMTAERG